VKQNQDTHTFDSVAAISVGGSYIETSGAFVRDAAASSPIADKDPAKVADAAPGASAELNAADGGVPLAPAEASASGTKSKR
jgi:sulfite reductase beta subunit-like hemoprotein